MSSFSRPAVAIVLGGTLFLSVAAGAAYAYASNHPDLGRRLALAQCKLYESSTEQSECVFVIIRNALRSAGMEAALAYFETASRMYPRGLDVDCHSGIHRVGDMVYFDLYLTNPDIAAYEFPRAASMCNRGFYHGIFEHLIQDNPSPEFIVRVCRHFKKEEDRLSPVAHTCFHAAGHGLFRDRAEQVPESDWGNAMTFVGPPTEVCASLPGTTERERYNCTTGVESIFIQTALQREYGFHDPNPYNRLAVCDQLSRHLLDPCYFVRSLMVSQIDDGYERILKNCSGKSDELFNACIRGTIVGLVVNGVREESFRKSLAFCAEPEVARYDATGECYKRLGLQLQIEPWNGYKVDCTRIPAPYSEFCPAEEYQPS